MADKLPPFIALKSVRSGGYACYTKDDEKLVCCDEKNVFSPFVKIEVVPAKSDNKHVHLRFCRTNKYWGQLGPGELEHDIVATSDKPDEDTSKSSCTLFEPNITSSDDGQIILYFIHAPMGNYLEVRSVNEINDRPKVVVGCSSLNKLEKMHTFTFVDYDTLVQMPRRVCFKGYNGRYLEDVWREDHPYLQFSSEDGDDERSAYEVQSSPTGYVRIRSEYRGKYWRLSPNWIWADSTDDDGTDKNTLFWPVKVDSHTIALRNAGNNRFCIRLTTEGKTNCLNAAVSSISREARLWMEELVFERNIYNVKYLMDEARVFNEKPFLAGTGTASNHSDTESSLTIRVSYEDTRSRSFTKGVSVMVGVKANLKAGFPIIADGQIEVSTEVTGSLVWDETTEEKKVVEALYTVKVPPKTRVRVNYVGTQGRCSVPFSYTQSDKKSSDGTFVRSQHMDGVFNGVNYYNFDFDQPQIQPL